MRIVHVSIALLGLSALAMVACSSGEEGTIVPASNADASTPVPTEGDASNADASVQPDVSAQPDGGNAPVVLGKVTEKGMCNKPTTLGNAKCYSATVADCPSVPAMDVDLLVADPPTLPAKGTIIFGSGGGGGAFYEDAGNGNTVTVAMLERLRLKGYRIVERAWAGPPQSGQWFEGTAGPRANSCRYGTLSTWIKTKFHQNQGKFCGTGNSGGSVELAYALTHQGRGDIFDYTLFTSGPAWRFDYQCESKPGAAWQTECDQVLAGRSWDCGGNSAPVCAIDPGIKNLVDSSWRPDTPCATGGAANASKLLDNSPLGPGAATDFPKTKLEFFEASNDCNNGVVPGGLAFAKRVTGMGGTPKVTILPGVGHSIHANVDGAAAIEAAMEASCK